MRCQVELPLERGGSVLVEGGELPPVGPEMRRVGKDHPTLAAWADKIFGEATAELTPVTASLVAQFRSISNPAAEIWIEAGAQTGAFIVSAEAAANFKASMTWRDSAEA
jgi:hypothetical protein